VSGEERWRKLLKEEEPHDVSAWIGWCKDCGEVSVFNPEALIKQAPLSEKVRDAVEHSFVCEACGAPIPGSREEVKEMEGCWWCGSRRAKRVK